MQCLPATGILAVAGGSAAGVVTFIVATPFTTVFSP
jgi:hypothetical protein